MQIAPFNILQLLYSVIVDYLAYVSWTADACCLYFIRLL